MKSETSVLMIVSYETPKIIIDGKEAEIRSRMEIIRVLEIRMYEHQITISSEGSTTEITLTEVEPPMMTLMRAIKNYMDREKHLVVVYAKRPLKDWVCIESSGWQNVYNID